MLLSNGGRDLKLRYRPQLDVVVALIMAASMWLYVERVLIPYQQADATRHERPRGNLSDLYPRWLGARELLLHHRDPYSPEITREVQVGYYGRVLDPQRPNDPRDQQAFAYPLYVVVLLAPTVQLPFAAVQIGFKWLLFSLTVISVPLWIRAVHWRPTWSTSVVCALLTLGSYPAAQGIKLQQLSLFVSVLIALAAALLASGRLRPAGVLLAVATIKPQLAIPLAGWLTLWSLADISRRWRFLVGFCLTLVILFAAAEYELPGWLSQFRGAIAAYGQYTDSRSVLDVLLTPGLGRIASALVVLWVALVCWRRRKVAVDSDEFALCLSLVLAATVVVIPTFAPYNQLLLLPAIFLIIQSSARLREKSASRAISMISLGLILWPWVAAVALVVASFFVRSPAVQVAWAVPLYTSLAIPLGVLAMLASLTPSCEERLHLSPLGR